MLIPRVPSKMCWLVSVLKVILFATAVSSLCPEGAFSSVKESKETCITLHTVGKSTKVVLPHSLPPSAPYLIFVIFLHQQIFWRIKFTPKKRVNYGKIHSNLPIFCVITAKYTVNCQIFALNLKKFTPAKKKFT